MCGIAGYISFTKPVDSDSIHAMNHAQHHRGPDGNGIFLSSNTMAGLGHTRLSFLDLTQAGKQPMQTVNGELSITYNGEIYNYIELRKQLEQLGCQFQSQTDTEVILLGYKQWGEQVLQKLKGMFAFAIWSETKHELFIARDRFGIKPLYYYPTKDNFIFASEIKGIKANKNASTTLDYKSFTDFFVYRYVPSPNTIWREIKKLPPAHSLLLKADGSIQIKQYWSLSYSDTVISDKQAVEKFDELLFNSVQAHVRSDVPIGSFLSGGYDSSAIVYYLNRMGYNPSTFSIGFKGWPESEHQYAELVAKQYNTNHHSLVLESQSLDILDHLAWVFDEPIGDISTIPTYLVSQLASKSVKAVMSGEGSDEILVGYQWQKDYSKPKRSWKEKFADLFSSASKPFVLEYYSSCMAMGNYDATELKMLLQPQYHSYINTDPDWFYKSLYKPELPDLKAMQVLDVKHFMGEQVLAKIDRASMANSLEVRVPFLDHEISEFVFGLKLDVYYKKEETKHLLYQNIKNHLPQQILNRKKQGFVGPDTYYMNMQWYQERLSDCKLATDGIINKNYVDQLLQNKDHWRLWKIAVMESWYRKWC